MSNDSEIRCPYCLTKRKVSASIKGNILCVSCGRRFSITSALPVGSDSLMDIPFEAQPVNYLNWVIFFSVLTIINTLVYLYSPGWGGIGFSICFVIFSIVCIIFSRLDIVGIPFALFIAVESIGSVRIISAYQEGMRDFAFLILVMVVSGILILSDSLSFSFESEGGGCGGGCGGCGGCG